MKFAAILFSMFTIAACGTEPDLFEDEIDADAPSTKESAVMRTCEDATLRYATNCTSLGGTFGGCDVTQLDMEKAGIQCSCSVSGTQVSYCQSVIY